MSERRKILIAFAVPALVALALLGVVLWLVLSGGDEQQVALPITPTPVLEASATPTATATSTGTSTPEASATPVRPAPALPSATPEILQPLAAPTAPVEEALPTPTARVEEPLPEIIPPVEGPQPTPLPTPVQTDTPIPTPSPAVLDAAILATITPEGWPADSASQFDVQVANVGPEAKPGGDFSVNCRIFVVDYKTNTDSSEYVEKVDQLSGGAYEVVTLSLPFAFDFQSYAYSIDCHMEPVGGPRGFVDPNPTNDSGTWYEPLFTDLAVTAIYANTLPKGEIFLNVTNNGPNSLNSVTLGTACWGSRTEYATGAKEEIQMNIQWNTVSLSQGETKSFLGGITVDTSKYWYLIACRARSLDVADPHPSNDTINEYIPPPP